MISSVIALISMILARQKIGLVGVIIVICMALIELLINIIFSNRELK